MKKLLKVFLGVALLLALAVAAPRKAEAATGYYSMKNPVQVYVARESTLSHITVGWTPLKGAKGYQVYMKEERGGTTKFKKVATVKGLTYVSESLRSSTYYIKVRAYAKKNGKTVYSPFSEIKTVDTGSISFSEFGIGFPSSAKEMPDLLTAIGGMKKISSKNYPTFAAKGNGIWLGVNENAHYPNPYFYLRVKGNRGIYVGGIQCGYTRADALSVSGADFSSYDGGKTFVWHDGNGVYAGVVMKPKYDKNDVITEMVLTMKPSG